MKQFAGILMTAALMAIACQVWPGDRPTQCFALLGCCNYWLLRERIDRGIARKEAQQQIDRYAAASFARVKAAARRSNAGPDNT